MIKFSIVFGTRPEVIKLASLIRILGANKNVELHVCFTGQHREMVLPLLNFFEISQYHSLNIMQPNQSLAGLTARAIAALDEYLVSVRPDMVFVQGDTTTAMCAATAAFYRRIKIAHVEAGLRTFDIHSPFPEEYNRQVISKIADLHFTPTKQSYENLLGEGLSKNRIFITGNTVIDTLLYTQRKLVENPELYIPEWDFGRNDRKIILITGHRRENFGEGFENICSSIKELAVIYQNIDFVYPVHLNPNVQEPVKRLLTGQPNIFLIAPMNYIEFTALMSRSYFILTDSGGVQEEAPSLNKPVLIMRDSTERQEAVDAGAAILVGTVKEAIVEKAKLLIEDEKVYKRMSNTINPFGIGKAAEEILKHSLQFFS